LGRSVPNKKMKKLICDNCDLNQKCKFYQRGQYKFSVGQQSTHNLKWGNLQEMAMWCVHREKIEPLYGVKG